MNNTAARSHFSIPMAAPWAPHAWPRRQVPSRPVHYERAGLRPHTDIYCPMYPSVEDIIAYAEQQPDRPLRRAETEKEIVLSGREFEVRFDKSKGSISSYRFQGTELIAAGPLPNFWRAPTDNDVGNGMPARCAAWKRASSSRKVDGFVEEKINDSTVRLAARFDLPDVQSKHETTYTVFGRWGRR